MCPSSEVALASLPTAIATVDGAARGLDEAAQIYYQLRSYQEQCRRTLREESDRLGQRTFEVGPYRVEVDSIAAATKPLYDVDALWEGLKDAGCPLERLHEAISYEPKVDGTVIRQLAQNPDYRRVIEAAVRERVEKVRNVRVKG